MRLNAEWDVIKSEPMELSDNLGEDPPKIIFKIPARSSIVDKNSVKTIILKLSSK